MAGIGQGQPHAGDDLGDRAVFHRHKEAQRPVRVVHIINRLIQRPARALGFAVAPLGFLHLDVGGVTQHDLAQRHRGRRGVDGAAETVFIKRRQHAAVVNVRVRQHHAVHAACGYRQLLVFVDVRALLHPAIDQDVLACRVQEIPAARYLAGRAQKT